jgi:hypothetical protein
VGITPENPDLWGFCGGPDDVLAADLSANGGTPCLAQPSRGVSVRLAPVRAKRRLTPIPGALAESRDSGYMRADHSFLRPSYPAAVEILLTMGQLNRVVTCTDTRRARDLDVHSANRGAAHHD